VAEKKNEINTDATQIYADRKTVLSVEFPVLRNSCSATAEG